MSVLHMKKEKKCFWNRGEWRSLGSCHEPEEWNVVGPQRGWGQIPTLTHQGSWEISVVKSLRLCNFPLLFVFFFLNLNSRNPNIKLETKLIQQMFRPETWLRCLRKWSFCLFSFFSPWCLPNEQFSKVVLAAHLGLSGCEEELQVRNNCL